MCNSCKCPAGKESNTEQWYEVFIDICYGTRTVACFDTLEEALQYRKKIIKEKEVYVDGELIEINTSDIVHIDKWEQKDFPFGKPEPIEKII